MKGCPTSRCAAKWRVPASPEPSRRPRELAPVEQTHVSLLIFDPVWLGRLAGLVGLAGFVPYVVAILAGQTQPNRATWIIWAVVGAMLAVSYRAAGAGATMWMAAAYVVGPVLIVWFGIRRGIGGWTRLDQACLGICAGSALLWAISGNPRLALALNIIADGCGALPTIAKVWRDPRSEDRLSWAVFMGAAALNLAACRPIAGETWNPAELSYPLYMFLTTGVVTLIQALKSPLSPVTQRTI
jgi:hypothetical protein